MKFIFITVIIFSLMSCVTNSAKTISSQTGAHERVFYDLQLRGLLAIKTGDGHIYATEPVSPSSLNIFLVILLVSLGLITLPLFGIDLVFLWLAWKLWRVT